MGLSFKDDAFEGIPKHDVVLLLAKIDWLWDNRQSIVHHSLGENLSGFFKRRLGKYRIIYIYEAGSDTMIVHLVGLRDDIYKRLS